MSSSTGGKELHHQYQSASAHWSRLVRRNTLAESTPPTTTTIPVVAPTAVQIPPQLSLLPLLLPQTTSYHQDQLAQYNRLIAAGRATQISTPPLPPLLSAHNIQAVPRRRSSTTISTITERKPKSAVRAGHGNRVAQKSSKGERALLTGETANMPGKKMDLKQLPRRPFAQHQNSNISAQSNSVPSTPHQRPRKLSFESRDPSPNQEGNHSPRSAYSESNITLPSARPHPQTQGRCIYETAMAHTRRRMPYSIGGERLEALKDTDIKSKLSEDEERSLTTNMRELYDRLLPTSASEDRRRKLVAKLEKLFNDEWPGHDIRVHMFGSSGNLLCTDSSDVDLCITTDWKEFKSVCKIAALLANNGMQQVICVSTAKVPIVKVFDPELGLHCDMNVNNTLALENTRMIKTYVQIDPRVRPLAMIIKHWTKRRVVNDAGKCDGPFGGTLSSYTWICMIINFLQSREPPVLPSLQQRQHQKIPNPNGAPSSFADDVEKLCSFGRRNKATLGELLFHFFRFYGHEFDYDNLVISVRNGRLISKMDKKWHLATNNMLCVEEPFNTSRNLGNTADDTSFRGLHVEMRRAFNLISQGKLAECCEEYVFPKEEERVWERPIPKPKPTLTISRSASQSNRGGRGGSHRGGRHNNHRNGGNSRRSSAGFDHNSYVPAGLQPNMTPRDAWMQQQAQVQLHNHLYQTYSVLQAQENSLRQQLHAQTLAEAQAQAQYNQTQGRQGPSTSTSQAGDRDRQRGNSFDQPPLTAPLRPEMYFYPLQYQGSPMFGMQSPSTNPPSPSMNSAVPELRRSVHRSSVTNGSEQSSSSLRSHSQPASRPAPSQPSLNGNGLLHGLAIYQPTRQANGATIPNFIADENSDPGFDAPLPSARSLVTSPQDSSDRQYVGYYVNDAAKTPPRRLATSATCPPIPAFGEFRQSPRRLSTDQLPQSILDRMKRASRSPSPLDHERSLATESSAPLTAASSQQGVSNANLRALNSQGPLVVNGSNFTSPVSISKWQRTLSGSTSSDDRGSEAAAASTSTVPTSMTANEADVFGQIPLSSNSPPRDPPLVVNGSTSTTEPEPLPTASQVQQPFVNNLSPSELSNGVTRLSPNSRLRNARQVQNGGVSPLDIGAGPADVDLSNLSPVYETRTPSPTANRKFEPSPSRSMQTNGFTSDESSTTPKPIKLAPLNGFAFAPPTSTSPSPNGHTRAAKSEGNGLGTWQKIPKMRRKGLVDLKSAMIEQAFEHREVLPDDEAERKGG